MNPDGTKSALQFTDDNNDLNGPVDLLEVDEEELIRTEYISVPQAERSLGERLIDEVVVPVIRDATTQLLEYGTEKAEIWIEEKVVPMAKSKVKAGWENLKLFISAIKDFDKPIKATQIVTERKNTFKASEIEVVNRENAELRLERICALQRGEWTACRAIRRLPRQTWNLFQVLIYLKMKIAGNRSVQKIKRVQLWRH